MEMIRPFVPPPVTTAYDISIYISHEDLIREREFSKSEAEIIRGKTFPQSMTISWQRWSGGSERLVITAKNNKSVLLDYREHNFYQRYCRYDGPVFSIGFGEQSNGRFEVLVKPQGISMYLIGGRFGVKPVTWEDRYVEHKIVPKPEWVLFQIPLQESALASYQTGQATFDSSYGLPARSYSLPHAENPNVLTGFSCSLVLYSELRPLFLALVKQVGLRDDRTGGAGVLVFFNAGGFPPWKNDGESWINLKIEPGSPIQKDDRIYVVFDEYGLVERYWKADRLEDVDHTVNDDTGLFKDSTDQYPPPSSKRPPPNPL